MQMGIKGNLCTEQTIKQFLHYKIHRLIVYSILFMCRIYLQIRRSQSPKAADTNQPPLPAAAAAASTQATPTPNETTPTPNGITVPTREWLSTVLLPKIVQWSEEESARRQRQATMATAGGQCRGERSKGESLIPLGRYSQLYVELKEKYGPTLVQVYIRVLHR